MAIVRPEEPAEPEATNKPKGPDYPSMTFRDSSVDNLKKALGEMCEVGDEVVISVHAKCTGVQKNRWGQSVSFDIIGLDKSSGYKHPKGKSEVYKEEEESEDEKGE